MNHIDGQSWLLLSTCLLVSSCNGQSGTNGSKAIDPEQQIGQYVVESFEDSSGNLWFGTLSKGVAMYDGKALQYLTMHDGLPDNSVLSMAEDKNGTLWFGTDAGLSKYDGKRFVNYTEADGLCHPRVANLFIDSNDRMWIGTWGGVCHFDGSTFTDFPLPIPDVDLPATLETQNWVSAIMEDSKGNIWFGRSGYGATKYDPVSMAFTQFTKAEGLPSNCIQDIEEDDRGNFWFGMRVAERDDPDPDNRNGPGGLARFDGKAFTQFPEWPGLTENDVYSVSKDRSGKIWVGTTHNGAYRIDGDQFMNYTLKTGDGTTWGGITNFLEDKEGQIWFGCAGGLYRLDGMGVINVTQDGPWK